MTVPSHDLCRKREWSSNVLEIMLYYMRRSGQVRKCFMNHVGSTLLVKIIIDTFIIKIMDMRGNDRL